MDRAKKLGDDGSMPGKKKRDSLFTDAQIRVLISTVEKARKKFKNQEELALAIGVTQPSLSNLLHMKWKPGLGTAQAIAHLEGITLEELIGPVRPDEWGGPSSPHWPTVPKSRGMRALPRWHALMVRVDSRCRPRRVLRPRRHARASVGTEARRA